MMRKSFATLTALTLLTTVVMAGDTTVQDFDAMHKSNVERAEKEIADMRAAEERLNRDIDVVNSDKAANEFRSSAGEAAKNAADNAVSLGRSGPVRPGTAPEAADKAVGVVKDMRDVVQKRDEFLNGPDQQRELVKELQSIQEKREATERGLATQKTFYATTRPQLVAKEKAANEKAAQEKAAAERQRAADRPAMPTREHSPESGGASRGMDYKSIDKGLIDKGMNGLDKLGGRQPS